MDVRPDFQAIFEGGPGLLLVLDPALTIVAASDAYLSATMTRRDQIVGRPLFEVFPDNPHDPAADGVRNLRASLDRVRTESRPDTMAVQKYDIQRPSPAGPIFEVRYWSPVNTPVVGHDGSLRYIVHRVEDVTELVQLREGGGDASKLDGAVQLARQNHEMEVELYHRGVELQRANDELRRVRLELEERVRVGSQHLDQSRESLVTAVGEQRKTEEALRRTEQRLAQAQKMEAVGRLAGGVAHDFNNLLSVILGYTEMMCADGGASSPWAQGLEAIQQAGRRAADLTRQLLTFSRQQVVEPRLLDLNEIVRESARMLVRLLGEDVELVTRCEPALWTVRADAGQLSQVILNLAVNARDAMPRGGKLTIETANVELDDEQAFDHPGAGPGPYAMVAVSDTGVGMDADTRSRMFEPFFTTKEPGRGTGLGLATVLGIVQQSRGTIWAYSEPGRGTTMKVYLPRAPHDAVDRVRSPVTTHTLAGTETVLVVEDQHDVREVVVRILKRFGYQIVEASSPGEALLNGETHPGAIDLLLTDIVMPRMGGLELSKRLGRMRPGLRVLYMSGYTDAAVLGHGLLEAGAAYLQKPFMPETLARRLRECLGGPPPAGAPVT